MNGAGAWMRANLTTQGYCLTNDERRQLASGLRFSTGACLVLVAVALALHSEAMVFALCAVGLVAGFSARHPFGHMWNHAVRHLIAGPALPPNPRCRRDAFNQSDHHLKGASSMTTEVRQLDTLELKKRVQHMYEEVALKPEGEFHFETGRPLAQRLGYPPADLDRVPAAAIDSFAGVGYFLDLAALQPGETVLDLGSGSGMDTFLAANQVGAQGRVIGVDMTDAQLAKARTLAADGGFTQAYFRHGYIETPPADDGSIDCVISNGVINLSPDKPAVFAASARALHPGGRLAVADIVTEHQLPEGVSCDAALWAACIGGAMQRDSYRHAIEDAGFTVTEWRTNTEYRFVSERADNARQKYGVTSISITAVKS